MYVKYKINTSGARYDVAWENSWHFSMLQYLFTLKVASAKQAQKFHTNDMSLPRSQGCFWLAEANFPCGMTNKKHCPDLIDQKSSVQNFCVLISRTSFHVENSYSITICWLLSHTRLDDLDNWGDRNLWSFQSLILLGQLQWSRQYQ